MFRVSSGGISSNLRTDFYLIHDVIHGVDREMAGRKKKEEKMTLRVSDKPILGVQDVPVVIPTLVPSAVHRRRPSIPLTPVGAGGPVRALCPA